MVHVMHYGWMGVLVQIRDVDEAVRDKLKAKALDEGLSLNAYLRRLVTRDAEVRGGATVIARIRARGNLVDDSVSSVDIIAAARAERDAQFAASWEERHGVGDGA